MKTLFLFDLDGTLLDSKANMQRAWTEVQHQFGIEIPFSAYFDRIGVPFRDILAQLQIKGELSVEIEQVFKAASLEDLHSSQFFDGALRTLLRLREKGAKLGIVTSKDLLRTQAVLRQIRVDFSTVQTPNSYHRGKPAPDHLLLAMAEGRTDPCDTLYVGDMAADQLAACRAGVDYAHATWGYGQSIPWLDSSAKYENLASFDDLYQYMSVGG